MIIIFVVGYQVSMPLPFELYKCFSIEVLTTVIFWLLGKQAVLVLICDNPHMNNDVMVDPGLVMIFAHGVE